MPPSQKKPSYPNGRFTWIGALLLGLGLPGLMGLMSLGDGVPHGHGSGSEVVNGLSIFIFPFLAVVGSVVGAFLGELLGLALFAIAWLRARRS